MNRAGDQMNRFGDQMNKAGDQMNTTYSISTADIPQTSTLRLHTKMEQPLVGDQMNTSSDQMNTTRLQPQVSDQMNKSSDQMNKSSDQMNKSSDQMNTLRLLQPPPAEKIISTKLAVGEARTAFNEDQVVTQ